MTRVFQAKNEDHYTAARVLFREYADGLGHDLCFQHFAEELEDLAGAYAPPGGCLLLAADGDDWAGCVAMRAFQASPAICEMKRLYVRPRRRGRGLGRRLAEAAIDAARTARYGRMRLDTLRSMELARGLYCSLGFREIPPYYDNPIDDVAFYELNLTRATHVHQ